MDLSKIYRMRVFSLDDVATEFAITKTSASKALLRWQQKGIVQMIRKNMYTAIDLSSGKPIVDRYEIASKASATSFVGWHSALEYHGLAHQLFFTTYVGSSSRFNKFKFEESEFVYCADPHLGMLDAGILVPDGNPHVRVTDLERTIVDCCDRLDRAGGAEELLHCLDGVVMLDERKLLSYMELYGKAFLYQKVGFLLERIQQQAHISDEFIALCREKGALHVKLLTNGPESDSYVKGWKLYVPSYCITETTDLYDFV